jgi:uncharacterized damage-inducible protein DinB
MAGFLETWVLTRERLEPAFADLKKEQLLWTPYRGARSIGEILYHIAGAEYYYSTRVTGRDPARTDWQRRLDRALVAGFLSDEPMPFSDQDMEPSLVEEALRFSGAQIRPVLADLTDENLSRPIVTGMGDHLKGVDGLARVAMHAGYHTGQIWVYRRDPRFPAESR